MSAPHMLARKWALALMRHARHVLPRNRSLWAEAMLHEIDHIENERSALSWAFGCVLASYSERIKAMDVFRSVIGGDAEMRWTQAGDGARLVRSVLALMIAFEAFSALFA